MTTTLVEKERADRFPPARLGYLMWTRGQAESAREMLPEEPVTEPDTSISDKFNQDGQSS